MQVVLKDGKRKGEMFNIQATEGTFPVLTTEDSVYAYDLYMLIPARTVLGEQLAVYVRSVKRK